MKFVQYIGTSFVIACSFEAIAIGEKDGQRERERVGKEFNNNYNSEQTLSAEAESQDRWVSFFELFNLQICKCVVRKHYYFLSINGLITIYLYNDNRNTMNCSRLSAVTVYNCPATIIQRDVCCTKHDVCLSVCCSFCLAIQRSKYGYQVQRTEICEIEKCQQLL